MAFGRSSLEDLPPVAEINVTPLIDVMLVLLVIFMVTAPLLESGIPIELPKASAKALPKDASPTTLNLTKDFRIFLNKTEVPPSELVGQLKSYFKDRTGAQIFIRADGSLPYNFVARSMAAVKAAGIQRIGLVTSPEESKK
jgi:biopolymer transport protein TolR